MRKGGCWIFLSHSSKDILKVRQIRNEFEKMGHNPLAFHLLCLNDKTKRGKTELDNLIKREIDAREWFVFCDSPSAQQSVYVNDEQQYVKSRGKQMIWTIDLEQDMDKILDDVRKICTRIEVFVSYNHKDTPIVEKLIGILEQKDYAIWTDKDVVSTSNWAEQTAQAITNCTKSGVFVLLLTPNSVNNNFVNKEVHFACTKGATILPIMVGECRLSDSLQFLLANTQIYNLPLEFTQDDCQTIIQAIDDIIKKSTY